MSQTQTASLNEQESHEGNEKKAKSRRPASQYISGPSCSGCCIRLATPFESETDYFRYCIPATETQSLAVSFVLSTFNAGIHSKLSVGPSLRQRR